MALQSFLFLCFAGQLGLHCGIDIRDTSVNKRQKDVLWIFFFYSMVFFDILCESSLLTATYICIAFGVVWIDSLFPFFSLSFFKELFALWL